MGSLVENCCLMKMQWFMLNYVELIYFVALLYWIELLSRYPFFFPNPFFSFSFATPVSIFVVRRCYLRLPRLFSKKQIVFPKRLASWFLDSCLRVAVLFFSWEQNCDALCGAGQTIFSQGLIGHKLVNYRDYLALGWWWFVIAIIWFQIPVMPGIRK